jgi:hypothetical protein
VETRSSETSAYSPLKYVASMMSTTAARPSQNTTGTNGTPAHVAMRAPSRYGSIPTDRNGTRAMAAQPLARAAIPDGAAAALKRASSKSFAP